MSAAYEKVAREILNNVKDGDDEPGDVDAIVGILERELNPTKVRLYAAERVILAARRFMKYNGSGERGTVYDAAEAYKWGEALGAELKAYKERFR